MNLKDFSLMKEDAENYTVGHPKGKSMVIPKRGLSTQAQELISKLKKHQNFAEGTPEGTEEIPYDKLIAEKEAQEVPYGTAGVSQPKAPVAAPASPAAVSSSSDEAPVPIDLPDHPALQKGTPAYAELKPAENEAEQLAAHESQQPSSNSPQLAPNTTPGLEEAKGEIKSALSTQKEAARKEQKAFQEVIPKIEALTPAPELQKKFQARDDLLQQSAADKTIDPNRLYKNMDTGSKIASGLAMILGGIGAGLTGGPNLAAQQINRAIERDIDAQRNDQSKAMNLWKMNREAYRDDQQATLATQNQLLGLAKVKAMEAAAGASSAAARERLAPIILGFDQQIATNNWMRSRLSGGPQGTEQNHLNEMQVMQQIRPDLYKEMESKYIPGIGVTRTPATENDRQTLRALAVLENGVNAAIDFTQNIGTTAPLTPNNAAANAIRQDLVTGFQTLHDLKRLSDVDLKLNLSNIASPGSFLSQTALAQFKTLKDKILDKKKVEYNQMGVTPFAKAPDAAQAAAFARLNPSDPRSFQINKVLGGQ